MIRLTGLPSAARWPDATVARGAGRIAILFSGPGVAERRIDVEYRLLGDADPEEEELPLLARLGELGYRVTRAHPGPDG
jgi:hypothetical protein